MVVAVARALAVAVAAAVAAAVTVEGRWFRTQELRVVLVRTGLSYFRRHESWMDRRDGERSTRRSILLGGARSPPGPDDSILHQVASG